MWETILAAILKNNAGDLSTIASEVGHEKLALLVPQFAAIVKTAAAAAAPPAATPAVAAPVAK